MKSIKIAKTYDCGDISGCKCTYCWNMRIVTNGYSSTYSLGMNKYSSNIIRLFIHLLKWS